MSDHANGPWELGGCSGRMITTVSKYVGDGFIADVDTLANARRIVACVNACRDFDTDELVENYDGTSMTLKFVMDQQADCISDLRRQLETLLASCEELYSECLSERDCFYDGCTTSDGKIPDPIEAQSLAEIDAKLDRAKAAMAAVIGGK